MSYGAGGSLFPFADNSNNILVLFVDIVKERPTASVAPDLYKNKNAGAL